MKRKFQGVLLVMVSGFFLALVGCGGGGGESTSDQPIPTTVVSPLPLPGPYAVACSNVEQDFGRVVLDEDAQDYWEGAPTSDGTPRDMTDLLVDPTEALSVMVTAPNDDNLYGAFAGEEYKFVVLACYPTTTDNPRADYLLPTDGVVPHMQVGDELPLLTDPEARYPLIAFAHGYRGSPLSSGYIETMAVLASYGYIVAAPFYGDPHFTDLAVDKLEDRLALLGNLEDFVALQALRALATSAVLDLMLSDPQWSDHIDETQIGGFGASMGGETLLLMAGAGLTSSINASLDFEHTQVIHDTRLKAAVGYVPFFGSYFLPAFGSGQRGLENVTLPYLAISGTADTTAPMVTTEEGMNRLSGTRELVSLAGVEHRFDVESTNDIFTWALTFLDAEVRGNPAARQKLSTMGSVAGGGDDRVEVPYNGLSVD